MQIDPKLSAQIEPFDSFWEAPRNIEKGYSSFNKFYLRNYFKYLSVQPDQKVLVVSCGPGYFLEVLKQQGVSDVLGIDCDPHKVAYAKARRLNARVANVFGFLADSAETYDMIFAEQEINHLTKEEMRRFFELCHQKLNPGGVLVVHSLNGANPVTGAEALAQNFDHYNTLTEYSLRQIMETCGFQSVKVFPLRLYVFYENPVNYVGMFLDALLTILFRTAFIFYGKSNRLFTKKIAAIGRKQ